MTTTELSSDMPGEREGLVTRLSRIFARGRKDAGGRFQTSEETLDRYVAEMPSGQAAIDSLPGWVGAMPPQTGLKAGNTPLFADTRISWLLRECYDVAGKKVLELGPLEGSHTYMLHRAGAASIDAIEANTLAFHRCLITKEVLGLANARFHLGDFLKWLERTDTRYDLIVASGVLYHSDNPVRLLELIADKADAFFLWTHYFDEAAMPPSDPRRKPFSEAIEHRETGGVEMRLHERSYFKAWQDPSFCGGLQDRHFWIERTDLLSFIKARGFATVKIANEDPAHSNGPCFSVFAGRAATAGARPAPAGGAGARRIAAAAKPAKRQGLKNKGRAVQPGREPLLVLPPVPAKANRGAAGGPKAVPRGPQPSEKRTGNDEKPVNRHGRAASRLSGREDER